MLASQGLHRDEAEGRGAKDANLLHHLLDREGRGLGVPAGGRAEDEAVAHQRVRVALDGEAVVRAVDEALVIDIQGLALAEADTGEGLISAMLVNVGVFTDLHETDGVGLGVDEDGFLFVGSGHTRGIMPALGETSSFIFIYFHPVPTHTILCTRNNPPRRVGVSLTPVRHTRPRPHRQTRPSGRVRCTRRGEHHTSRPWT